LSRYKEAKASSVGGAVPVSALDETLEAKADLEVLMAVLRFTALLLRNAINKQVYTSGEHISKLLGARDDALSHLALEVTYLLALPPPFHCQNRLEIQMPPGPLHGDKNISRKLFHFTQGWGTKSQGLGVIACLSVEGQSALPKCGGDLHFEYLSQEASSLSAAAGSGNSHTTVRTIHVDDLAHDPRPAWLILLDLLAAHPDLPPSHHLSLLARIRVVKAFVSRDTRVHAVVVRLQALAALLYCNANTDTSRLFSLFQSQPELIHELVEVVGMYPNLLGGLEDHLRGMEVALLALDTLTALVSSRLSTRSSTSQNLNIFQELGVQRGQYTGLVPSLFRYAEISLTTEAAGPILPFGAVSTNTASSASGSSSMDLELGIAFVQAASSRSGARTNLPSAAEDEAARRRDRELYWLEGVMNLVCAVVMSQQGAVALTECGLVPALLNVLRAPMGSTEPPPTSTRAYPWGYQARRTYVIAYASYILETVIMSTNVALNTFREINAATFIVQRVHDEVEALRQESSDMVVDEPSPSLGSGKKSGQDTSLREASPSTKVLIYSLLTLLTVAFQSQGGQHIQGSSEGSQHLRSPALTKVLIDIMRNTLSFNGSVLARASALFSDIISNDPSVVSYVHSSGLASSFLSMLSATARIPASSEMVADIPNILATLAINNDGLQAVVNANPFPAILRIFYSPEFILPSSRCLHGLIPSNIGSCLEELVSSHTAQLRPLVLREVGVAIRKLVAIGQQVKAAGYQEADRWQLLQYVNHMGQFLAKLLAKPEHAQAFLEDDGAESLVELYQLVLGNGQGFLSTVSSAVNWSGFQPLGHPPALIAIGLAMKTLVSHDSLRLVRRLLKVLKIQLEALAQDRDRLEKASGAPKDVDVDEEDAMDVVPDEETSGGGSKSGGTTVHACGVLRMAPDCGIHNVPKGSGNVIEAFAGYLQRIVLIDWLTGWLAASVAKGAHLFHRGTQQGRGWGALVEKEGQQVLRKLRALHSSALTEVCTVRGQALSKWHVITQEESTTASMVPSGFRLRVVREEGAIVRDGAEAEEAERVRLLDFGSVVRASERRLTAAGVMAYRIEENGWISDERRSSSSSSSSSRLDERRTIAEVMEVLPGVGGKEESKETAPLSTPNGASILSLRLAGAGIMARLHSSQKGLMLVLSKVIMSSATRLGGGNRGWTEENGTTAQHTDVLVELVRSSCYKLLDRGLKMAPTVGADGTALYLADALEYVHGVLFDDRRDRVGQLNSYMAQQLLRGGKSASGKGEEDAGEFKVLPKLMEAIKAILSHCLELADEHSEVFMKLLRLTPVGGGASSSPSASLPYELRAVSLRERITSAVNSVWTLLKRLASRQLILDTQYVPLPPSVMKDTTLPTDSDELATTLHVLMGEALVPLWQAEIVTGRFANLPTDVLEKLLDIFRELQASLDDAGEATARSVSGSGRRGTGTSGSASLSGRGRMNRGMVYGNMPGSFLEVLGLPRPQEPQEFVPDEGVIQQLMEMGFGRAHILEALRHGNSNRVEYAVDYLMNNPPPPEPPASEAPSIPLNTTTTTTAGASSSDANNSGGEASVNASTSATSGTAAGAEVAGTSETAPATASSSTSGGETAADDSKMEAGGEDSAEGGSGTKSSVKKDQERAKELSHDLEEAIPPLCFTLLERACQRITTNIMASERVKPTSDSKAVPAGPSREEEILTSLARFTFIISEFLLALGRKKPQGPPGSNVASLTEEGKKRAALFRTHLLEGLSTHVLAALSAGPDPSLTGLLHLLVLLLKSLPEHREPFAATLPDPLMDTIEKAVMRDRFMSYGGNEVDECWPAWMSPAVLLLDLLAQPVVPSSIRAKERAKTATATTNGRGPTGRAQLSISNYFGMDDTDVDLAPTPPSGSAGARVGTSAATEASATNTTTPVGAATSTGGTTAEEKSEAADKSAVSASAGDNKGQELLPLLKPQQLQRSLTLVLRLLAAGGTELPLSPSITQAVFQLLSRLVRSFSLVPTFIKEGGVLNLLSLPKASIFPGHTGLLLVILRHLLEDPMTLQVIMEQEIRSALQRLLRKAGGSGTYAPGGQVQLRVFLNAVAPLACRDPKVFMEASERVVEVVDGTVGGGSIQGPFVRLRATPPSPHSPSTSTGDHKAGSNNNTSTATSVSSPPPSGKKAASGETCLSKSGGKGSKSPHRHSHKPSYNSAATLHTVMSLLLSRLLGQYSKSVSASQGEGQASSSSGKSPASVASHFAGSPLDKDHGFLDLVDVLELLTGLALALPNCAAALHRASFSTLFPQAPPIHSVLNGHVVDTVPSFLLHVLLPTPRPAINIASALAEPTAAAAQRTKTRTVQTAACLLVVLCVRSGEGRKRVIHEVADSLSFRSPNTKPGVPAADSEEEADRQKRRRWALQSWAELVLGLADPRATPNKRDSPHQEAQNTSQLSWEAVRLMLPEKDEQHNMVRALAKAVCMVDLQDARAPVVASALLRPLELLTRRSVEEHLTKLAAKAAATPPPSGTSTSGAATVGQAGGASASGRETSTIGPTGPSLAPSLHPASEGEHMMDEGGGGTTGATNSQLVGERDDAMMQIDDDHNHPPGIRATVEIYDGGADDDDDGDDDDDDHPDDHDVGHHTLPVHNDDDGSSDSGSEDDDEDGDDEDGHDDAGVHHGEAYDEEEEGDDGEGQNDGMFCILCIIRLCLKYE